MKINKKVKFNYYIAAIVLLVIFVATSTITFAFWSQGFFRTQETRSFEVIVGSDGKTQTAVTVDLASQSNIRILEGQQIAMNLVPIGMIGNHDTEIDYVVLTFSVRWIAADIQEDKLAHGPALNGAQGTLRVQCLAIMSGEENFWINDQDERILGEDELPLFLIDFWDGTNWVDEAFHNIIGHETAVLAPPAEVRVRLRMNVSTMSQYVRLAGQEIFLTFNFSVEWNGV